MDPGIKVKVKLVDAAGKPVAGAGVGAHSTWGLWAPNQKEELEILEFNPDRPRSLLFLHPERGIGKVVERTKGDVGPWTVVLEPTATGRLVTDDGKLIANALLQIHYRLPGHDAWTPSTLKELRTNDKGEFRLTNMVGGLSYSLSYSSERVGVRMQHYVRIQLKMCEAKNLGDVKPREN